MVLREGSVASQVSVVTYTHSQERIFQKERQREGSILCSIALRVLASIHQANIGDVRTYAGLAFVKNFGCNGHEIESLHLPQLQYVADCNFWHWRLRERRAL